MNTQIVQDRKSGRWVWVCPHCHKTRSSTTRDWLERMVDTHLDTVCPKTAPIRAADASHSGYETPSLLSMLEAV